MKIDKTLRKVKTYIEEKSLIQSGDHIVMGVSGGADSVCLFLMLCELKNEYNLTLECVCVNHGIRKEAGEEANYVKDLCDRYSVNYHLFEENVPAFASERGISEEEAGRIIRYEAFSKVQSLSGANKIAVAHNMNDNSETVLFNLFRGSSLSGLSGISPKRDNVIRPILCLERSEIETYLLLRNVKFYTDSTNNTDEYTRNKIRHHILPYAEKEIVENVNDHLFTTSESIREVDDFLCMSAKEAYLDCKESDNRINIQKLSAYHIAVQKKLIYTMLANLAPGRKDMTAGYVKDVLCLMKKEGTKSLDLSYGIKVKCEYGSLIFERGEGDSFSYTGTLKVLSADESQEVISSGIYRKSEFIKYLDYDKIKIQTEFRTRKPGDYIYVNSSEGVIKKSIKSIMINDKIPKDQRDKMQLLAAGDEILVIPGGRVNEKVKIDDSTCQILEVRYE